MYAAAAMPLCLFSLSLLFMPLAAYATAFCAESAYAAAIAAIFAILLIARHCCHAACRLADFAVSRDAVAAMALPRRVAAIAAMPLPYAIADFRCMAFDENALLLLLAVRFDLQSAACSSVQCAGDAEA